MIERGPMSRRPPEILWSTRAWAEAVAALPVQGPLACRTEQSVAAYRIGRRDRHPVIRLEDTFLETSRTDDHRAAE